MIAVEAHQLLDLLKVLQPLDAGLETGVGHSCLLI
jgi:hypothetical protein